MLLLAMAVCTSLLFLLGEYLLYLGYGFNLALGPYILSDVRVMA